jgi:hypothetical protein
MKMSTHLELFFQHRFVVYHQLLLSSLLTLLTCHLACCRYTVCIEYEYPPSLINYPLYPLLKMPRHSLYVTCLLFLLYCIPSLSLYSIHTTMSKQRQNQPGIKRVPSTPVPPQARKEPTPLQPGPAGTSTSGSTPKFYASPLFPCQQIMLISRMGPLYPKLLVYPTTRRMSLKRLFRLQRYTPQHIIPSIKLIPRSKAERQLL